MALTPEEQRELDQLEFEKLEAEKTAALGQRQAPALVAPPQPAPAPVIPSQSSSLKMAMAQGMLGNPYASRPMSPELAQRFATGAADMGAEAAGATGGQMLGTTTGPMAPVAVPVLGAIGGAAGNALAQFRQMKMGERDKFGLGEFFGAGAAGAVPGASQAKAGAKLGAKVLKGSIEMSKQAGGNIVAKATENLVDGKPLLTGKEAATAGVGAIIGATIAKGLDTGKNPHAIAVALAEAQDAGRRYTQKMGHELGYVFPPSMIRPNYANDVVNSIGGSAATMRDVIQRNQKITNNLIREELSLPETAVFARNQNGKVPSLETARIGPNAVYKEVDAASPQTSVALKAFQDKASEANTLRAQYRDTFPKNNAIRLARDAAEAERKQAEAVLKAELAKAGKPDLWDRFEAAKKKLAQIGIVEDSVNQATGDVDAALLGRMWDDNPGMLSGNLEKIGRFWTAFSKTAADASVQLPTAVNQLSVMAATMSEDPKMWATLTGLPRLARSAALSKPYQSRLEYFYGPTRQDAPAMLARFAAMSAGRQGQSPPQRPVPYR